ncbi:MAG TPA: hypothetical protein VMU92_02720 [Acidobacteriaceae bacterium]|nr:hypothetical protein [Acidobacteriaceae bacterium]
MKDTTVLVHLALHARSGKLLSENFYWRAASDAGIARSMRCPLRASQ